MRLKGLYVITGPRLGGGHLALARAALDGGATIVQLRDKDASDRELRSVALTLRRWTRQAGSLFIINDRIDLALSADADGVHLGPEDLPTQDARRLMGPHRLIGISCSDADEARIATLSGADYVGAGSIYATTTKSDAGSPIGLEGLRAIVSATTLPVAAVGGIAASNLADLRRAGASMAAVMTAVAGAGSPVAMTRAAAAMAAQFASPL